MSEYGFKISPPGVDVKSAANKDQFFVSDSPIFKAFKVLNVTVSTNGSGIGSTTTSHGLNYEPAFDVFIKGTARNWFDDGGLTYSNSFFPIQNLPFNGWYEFPFVSINAYATTAGIVIEASGGATLANKTLTFRIYCYVDNLRSAYLGDGLAPSGDFGLKISKPEIDVKTAKEHQLVYSSDYKALQFHNVHKYATRTITLPLQFASPIATPVESGGYVDFALGLGYQPYYKAFGFSSLDPDVLYELPHTEGLLSSGGSDVTGKIWASFCDSTKVRLSFFRRSKYTQDASSQTLTGNFVQETLNVKLLVFTENLAGDTYG